MLLEFMSVTVNDGEIFGEPFGRTSAKCNFIEIRVPFTDFVFSIGFPGPFVELLPIAFSVVPNQVQMFHDDFMGENFCVC